ncbi:MAG: glycosyltransferase 87 family protein [Chloroflexota bacterium]|nr:glycosyltransferase 87 family protein [Chloroflexota bacterium]
MIQSESLPAQQADVQVKDVSWSLAASERTRLVMVFAVALVQGLLYLFLLPPWQHYDEPTHFEYAWLYADLGYRPQESDINPAMRRELAASMIEHDFYWNLTPPDILANSGRIDIGILELPHPPTYYALVSLPLRVVNHLDLTTQLYVARTVSLLIFLGIILVAIGIMRDLAPPRHPLRWAVPLAIALFPPFVNQMTAVNNDVAAVLAYSFVLWGAVRTVCRGLSVMRLLWLVGAALLAVAIKTTAAPVILLIPLVIVMAFWRQRGWRWRWLWLGTAVMVVVPTMAVFNWEDAAYWYRDNWRGVQVSSSRLATPEAPFGSNALRLEVSETQWGQRLFNTLSAEQVEELVGKTVTVGGWIWADREAQVATPALIWSELGTTSVEVQTEMIPVTTTPTFVARSYTIPENSGKVHYAFLGEVQPRPEEPIEVFLDGAFLIEGEWDASGEPRLNEGDVIIGGRQVTNFLRNPSAEQHGPRISPWLATILNDYGRRPPDHIVTALYDVDRSGVFLLHVVIPFVLRDFPVAFAWGHVRLSPIWSTISIALLVASIMGAVKWLLGSRQSSVRRLWPALFVLAVALLITSIIVLLWPLSFRVWSKYTLPSSRYLYPAIIPIALLLVGGWWMLWPREYRRYALAALFVGLLAMNVAAVLTVHSFYEMVAGL